MSRRLIFAAVLVALLGGGVGTSLVGSASAATHDICVGDPQNPDMRWCVMWDDPKP